MFIKIKDCFFELIHNPTADCTCESCFYFHAVLECYKHRVYIDNKLKESCDYTNNYFDYRKITEPREILLAKLSTIQELKIINTETNDCLTNDFLDFINKRSFKSVCRTK